MKIMHYYLAFPCIIVFYLLFDVHYFLRTLFSIGWGRFLQKPSKVSEKHVNYGICLTTDVDIFLKHMNNARYVRELDFARNYYYYRTGIFEEIRRRKASVVQTATSIRYRRPINVFTIYKVTTQLIYWEERDMYIEHMFISLSDNFVRAVTLSKQTISGHTVDEIVGKLEPGLTRPPMTPELQMWRESLVASSSRFRKMRDPGREEELSPVLPEPATSLLQTTAVML